MNDTVSTTPKADPSIGRELQYRRREESEASADRWFVAADRAIESLAGTPEARPICRESDDLPGGTYREAYFGAGQSPTHRLVFRARGGAVEVVAVRGFGQRDLTARDL